jgi:hypothetical protein
MHQVRCEKELKEVRESSERGAVSKERVTKTTENNARNKYERC